jgi:predicted GIY-YIG superfamily endonuclease
MYWLYILESKSSGHFYTGSTENVPVRLREHNGELPSLGTSTVAGRPWELV